MRILETSCAISVVCLCLSLAQVPKDGPDKKPPRPTKTSNPVVDDMQGTWRLVKMDSQTLEKTRRQEVGFMLVSGDYFSLEVHIGWSTAEGAMTTRSFQSGMHRFEVDADNKMTASSVIGSAIDPESRILFEQPGKKREYMVDCSGNSLKLKREDLTTFEFERLVDSRPKRDFYGRPIKPKEPKEAGEAGKDGKDGKDGKETPPKKD